jgi:superfamily II DNA helicase RecQ
MLDNVPPTNLRINPTDVERRAGLERRKLREMIEFCYTEYCYRSHILDYFGDRHHARQCGTCGNCAPHTAAKTPLTSAEISSETGTPGNRQNRTATAELAAPRVLTDDENLRVRKILACAARMKGRFGKSTLAATLRGSAAKNVMRAHLNELSTYSLLKDMRQDDIMLYIDGLCAAGCLSVSHGEYPTISITEFGDRVMREQEQIELTFTEDGLAKDEEEPLLPTTALQTYTLFRNGHSVEEIATQRSLVTKTIEGHLIECMSAGLTVDVSRLVSEYDRAQIEKAIAEHGTAKLKPIHESLPESITYNMIRFVVEEHRLGKTAKGSR